jgi:hypothetical protein
MSLRRRGRGGASEGGFSAAALVKRFEVVGQGLGLGVADGIGAGPT